MKYILLLVAIVVITCTETLDSNIYTHSGPHESPIERIKKLFNQFKLFQNNGEVSLQIAPFVVPLITTVAPIVWDVVKKIFKW